MQLQQFNFDGTGGGISEMAVLTEPEYIQAGVAASAENGGCHIILGTQLRNPYDNKEGPANQHFALFASNGVLINTTLSNS